MGSLAAAAAMTAAQAVRADRCSADGLGRRYLKAAPGGVPLGYGPKSVRFF